MATIAYKQRGENGNKLLKDVYMMHEGMLSLEGRLQGAADVYQKP